MILFDVWWVLLFCSRLNEHVWSARHATPNGFAISDLYLMDENHSVVLDVIGIRAHFLGLVIE